MPARSLARITFDARLGAAVGGTAAVAVSLAMAPGAAGVLMAGLALIMTAIAVVDARRLIIPDELNAAGFALGLVQAATLGDPTLVALGTAVLRALVLGLAFLAVQQLYARWRGRSGMGLGDVKLAAVAGAWLDWQIMPIAIEIAAVSALLAYVIRQRLLGRSLRATAMLPFGLFFAPAIWLGCLLQTAWLGS